MGRAPHHQDGGSHADGASKAGSIGLGIERMRHPALMTALFWFAWATSAVAVVVPTLLWGARAHAEAVAAGHEEVARTTRSGTQFAENTFGLIDVVLSRLAELASDKDFGSASADRLCPSLICSNYQQLSPYLLLGFARANGEVVVYGSNAQPLSVRDRDYFLAQKDRDVGLFVGAPRRTPLMQGTGLPMSRRLSSNDGAFEGIAGAVINVGLVEAVFRGLGTGKVDAISLLGSNGQHLVDWSDGRAVSDPGSSTEAGDPACGSSSRWSSPGNIAATGRSQVGGLSVEVCLSKANALRGWRADVILAAGVEGLLFLAPALAFPALRRRWERRHRQQRGLRGLVTASSDVQFIVAAKPNGTFVLEALTFTRDGQWGRMSGRLVGRTTRELFPGAEADLVDADYRSVLASGETRRIERRVTLAGMRFVWSTLLVPLRDPGGGYIFGAASDLGGDPPSEGGLRVFTESVLRREDDERRRIARELHDTTGQNLIAAGFELAAVAQGLADAAPQVQAALAEARKLVDASVAELRTLSYVLYPPLLDEAGLGLALTTLAEGFGKRAGLAVTVHAEGLSGMRWAPEVELALYRVAQEALTNVQRHTTADTARVILRGGGPDRLELVVEDGCESSSVDPNSFSIVEGAGIRGMRDRLEVLGGTLTVMRIKDGFRVAATIPAEPVPGAK